MAKKPSIREFVSEESLKFQLYLLKFSNQLKDLEDMEEEEIENRWNYDTNKKINKWIKFLDDPKYKDGISQDALKFNIKYLKNLPAPINKDKILENFEVVRETYIKELTERIRLNSTASKKKDIEVLEYAKTIILKPSVSKEKFGGMLLLIVKNLSSMPSFSGYSSNWKTDFYSNAIEKTLLYLNNFDTSFKSVRSGENSKAFAYVTQIAYNAFLNVIIERKKGEEALKDTISLESANIEGVRTRSIKEQNYKEIEPTEKYWLRAKNIKDINKKIIQGMDYILSSNEILENNDNRLMEILRLDEDTPDEEKTEDYYLYIMDLKSKVLEELGNKRIDVLEIIKPIDLSLENWEKPNIEYKDIKLLISNPITKKPKKVEVAVEEIEEDYFDEW